MTQLEHLTAHPGVARRVAEGTLQLDGMYFHVAEAQAYILDRATGLFAAACRRPPCRTLPDPDDSDSSHSSRTRSKPFREEPLSGWARTDEVVPGHLGHPDKELA